MDRSVNLAKTGEQSTKEVGWSCIAAFSQHLAMPLCILLESPVPVLGWAVTTPGFSLVAWLIFGLKLGIDSACFLPLAFRVNSPLLHCNRVFYLNAAFDVVGVCLH